MAKDELDLVTTIGHGDPEAVAALIAAGADVRYKGEHGYDALLAAVHNRDVARDPRLLDLLSLLVASGVDLNGITTYQCPASTILAGARQLDLPVSVR